MRRRNLAHTLFIAGSMSVIFACGPEDIALTALDLDTMRNTVHAYGNAWQIGHPDSVMAVFADDPVLSPSGLPFLVGETAARAFWWPPGDPPTTVNRFAFTPLEADGAGDRGFVRGTFVLEFEFGGETYQSEGKFLSLQRRGADGSWRITHQFWDDLPRSP